jgi:hypothetical protein
MILECLIIPILGILYNELWSLLKQKLNRKKLRNQYAEAIKELIVLYEGIQSPHSF